VDFEFSDDQEQLRDSVRRFLADRAPVGSYVRPLLDQTENRRADVWNGLAELGVVGLLVPEEHGGSAPDDSGGSGTGMVDAAVVLEEMGRVVHPGPYLASAIGAVTLVTAAGSAREHSFLLPAMATGSVVGTVALLEPGRRFAIDNPITTAARLGDGWVLHGTKVHVPEAIGSDVLLVTASVAGEPGVAVFAVQTGSGGVTVEPVPTVDGTRKQATVTLDGAPGWRLGMGDAVAAVARTVDRMTVASVIDGVGAASRALELAVEYAKERIAFDHPIGSFQAVQHLCADMLRAVELGRAAGYYACWAADAADAAESHRAATMAKAFACEAFPQVGGSAIQVFGGIGFTWEHDIHLYYKRLLSLASNLGASDDALEELATLVLTPAG
jgi:alkylation response protein AidB-like acyl-CoA dehydrogenase